MGKDTTIISDLRIFFSKNDTSRAISSIMGVMEHIKIRSRQIGVTKKANCKLTALQVFNLLVLFPFFMVKNASSFAFSSLGRLFLCEKDMSYRFMNDGNVNWRSLLYSMAPSIHLLIFSSFHTSLILSAMRLRRRSTSVTFTCTCWWR